MTMTDDKERVIEVQWKEVEVKKKEVVAKIC